MRNLLAFLLFMPSLCLAQLPNHVPIDGLVGWYPLDGEIINAANPDEPGILTGGSFVLGQDGFAEGALEITNGSSAEIHPEIGTTESLTVSMWLNEGTNPPNSLQTALYLGQEGFDGDTTMSLDITRDRINHPGNGRLQANLNYDFGTAGFNELDGDWVHIVSIFDSGLLSIYRNGFLMESTVSSVSGIRITEASFLGSGHAGNNPEPFNFCHCALDDVGIWNRTLSPVEVTALYEGETPSSSGHSLSFNGINQYLNPAAHYVEVPYSADLDQTGALSFTITADVWFGAEGFPYCLFHTGQDGDPENSIRFNISVNETEFRWENMGVNYILGAQIETIETESWNNFSASWDGTLLSLYVNGILIAQDEPANGGPGETEDRPFYWGSELGGNTLNGQIDNAQIWEVCLSQEEILQFANCPPSGNETGLAALWNFDEADALVAIDATGNGHDGAINGASKLISTLYSNPNCNDETAIPSHVPAQGLAYWSEMDGNAMDASGQNVSASVTGAVGTSNRYGQGQSALAFDGVDDFALLFQEELGITFEDELTLAAWIRPDGSSLNGSHPRIFNATEGTGGGPDRWLFTWSPPLHSEIMQFGVSPTSEENTPYAQTPISIGTWQHVAVTFTEGSVTFFLNGEPDGQASIPTTSLSHVHASIQLASANGNSFFHGALDEVGIWGRALSSDEILALSTLSGCTDPMACNFNEEAEIDDGSCTNSTPLAPELLVSEQAGITLSVGSPVQAISWSNGVSQDSQVVNESGTYYATWTTAYSNDITSSADLTSDDAWISIPSLELPVEYTLQIWAHFPLPSTGDGQNTFFSDWNAGGAADLVHLYFHHTCGLGIDDQYEAGNCGVSGAFGTGLLASEVSEGWHLISVTSTPAGSQFYLDANDVGFVSHQVTGALSAIGNNAGGNGVASQQSGVIGPTTVWSEALTPAQIASTAQCPPSGDEDGLIAFWPMNNLINNAANDATGEFTGTLENASVSEDFPVFNCGSCQSKEWTVYILPSHCGEGTVWDSLLQTCIAVCPPADTTVVLTPSCGEGTVWDPILEECIVAIPADINFDGCVTVNDLLELLAVHGTCPPYPEWPDEPNDNVWNCGDAIEHYGYAYETVLIGDQCWFAENVRYVPHITPGTEISYDVPHVYIYGYNGTDSNEAIATSEYLLYGALYNHKALLELDICPTDWSIPTDTQFVQFELAVGMPVDQAWLDNTWRGEQAGLVKSIAWDGSNDFGFNAVPAGYKNDNSTAGSYAQVGTSAYFWTTSAGLESSSTQGNINQTGMEHSLFSNEVGIARNISNRRHGFSVRCLRN